MLAPDNFGLILPEPLISEPAKRLLPAFLWADYGEIN